MRFAASSGMKIGAKIATRTTTATSAKPISALTERSRFIASLQPHARIDVEIKQVDDQIGQHHDRGNDENRRLDQRDIAIEQGLIGEPTHTGVVEQRLDHDDAAEQITDLQ